MSSYVHSIPLSTKNLYSQTNIVSAWIWVQALEESSSGNDHSLHPTRVAAHSRNINLLDTEQHDPPVFKLCKQIPDRQRANRQQKTLAADLKAQQLKQESSSQQEVTTTHLTSNPRLAGRPTSRNSEEKTWPGSQPKRRTPFGNSFPGDSISDSPWIWSLTQVW